MNARILLDPLTATNPTGAPHTVTVTVEQNAGDGLGFVAATVGNVDVTLTNSGGAVAVLDPAASTCDDNQPNGDNLDASGQCIVVFTSTTAGTTTINATVTLVVGGVTLTRDTDPATLVGAGPGGTGPATKTWIAAGATLLIIDEDSIDNGIHVNKSGGLITPAGPHFFSDVDVNDPIAAYGQRTPLAYFSNSANFDQQITVTTGRTNDEGWFAPTCIPQKWVNGSTSNTCLTPQTRQPGIDAFWGSNNTSTLPQNKLDKIPAVMPLRALGLNALVGKTVCAVVYDSDISINYDRSTFPFTSGNLQGATLGIVAFTVDQTITLNGFSSSTLPQVKITIKNPSTCNPTQLFNAPVPKSSSVPNDRIAPGSPNGYRQLLTHPGQLQFF